MKSWLFTPSFCKAAMLSEFLAHVYQDEKNTEGFEHVIIDNHYPVDKERNHDLLKDLCHKYKCTYVNSGKDLGLHEGINHAMKLVGVGKDDIYVGCDPDDRPTHGAFQAIRDVMLADPMFAVLALNFWVIPWKIRDQGLKMETQTVAGHNIWIHPGVEMWNVAGFNMALTHEMGGFKQPNAYYGGIEIAFHNAWVKKGMKFGYLIDHTAEDVPVDRKNPELYDQSYGKWKVDHAMKGFRGSFEEWLQANG